MRSQLRVLALLVVAACARTPRYSSIAGFDAQVVDGVNRLRAATKAYQVLDSAVVAGYPKTVPQCLIHEHHGAMGYHHVNRGYVDAKVEIEKPEILLYDEPVTGLDPVNTAAVGRLILDIVCAAYWSAGHGGDPEPVPFTGPRDRIPLELWHGL